MIPFDFIYCRPTTLQEAIEAWWKLKSEGKSALYYAGGSETITLCRVGAISPDAVIDIKLIPELTKMAADRTFLHIGAACTLNQIKESNHFKLLGLACGRIADHTNQCRITLAGNLCGTIIYRETSLPLLCCDASVTLFGPDGERILPMQSIFGEQIKLFPGELVTAVHIPSWALDAPYAHIKKAANEKSTIRSPVSPRCKKTGLSVRLFRAFAPTPFGVKK
ncbi:Nicotinate dehydrogenase FAD-subunit [bioreactor metagenome]|uniref:Nicotinate dehydrogenase FAD-subunit n=1 Tax=bioreactor metagenome TaxID=1076179 RepID=A0A644YRU8_9ZZZZ